ncbi:MAG: hypothetical protein KAG94_00770 [Clostridiales bacterium]|nr:hypothetical protein [Clostridiales bacterium]
MRNYILLPERISKKNNSHDRFEVLDKLENNKIFESRRSWEGGNVGWPSFFYDKKEKIFKMWYLAISKDFDESSASTIIDNVKIKKRRMFICYATSKNGLIWNRPNLNKQCVKEYGNNNILLENKGKYIDGPSIIYDENANEDARYKMSYFEHMNLEQGVHTLVSKNGIDWIEVGKFPVLPAQDALKSHFDQEKNIYYLFLKDRIDNRRSRLLSSSKDFLNWSEPRAVLSPNLGDTDTTNFYDLFLFPQGDIIMGFLTVFDSSTQISSTELIYADEFMNIKRFTSRPKVLLPGDTNAWDGGGVYTSSGYLYKEEDKKIRYYYYGSSNKHDNIINNKKTKTGFGIANFNDLRLVGQQFLGDGEFCTTSILIKGEKLYINAKTILPLSVAIVSSGYPKSYKGYDYINCKPVIGDKYKHEVIFNDKNDISKFKGKYIKIKVKGNNSIVYGFTIE